METLVVPMAEDLALSTQWDDAPPPNFEEQEIDRLAFELWHRVNDPEMADEDPMSEEEALRCHASCL